MEGGFVSSEEPVVGPTQNFNNYLEARNKKNNFEREGARESFCFDSEYKRVKNSKRVRKKIRDVFNLGEKIENFVYPAEP